MNTVTTKRERVKPERKCSLRTEGNDTILSMTVITRGPRIGERVETFRYRLRSLDGCAGLAFRVEKLDHLEPGEPDNYDIALDPDGITDPDGGAHSCECKGYLKWGHCKHIESLLALIEAGVL